MYQLIEEKGIQDHIYRYDSVHNRLAENGAQYSVDQYNKITSGNQCHYTYDKNGNLIQMQQGDSITRYAYDALDRLIQVNDTYYSYDSFNRRISRTQNGTTEQFLYFGLREIGCTINDRLHEFRVLGIGKGAELGATVAIELDGQVYAPIADFRGNIVALISAETRCTAESYRYTAFGECVQAGALKVANFWRFASKRFDPESGFVYFGRRYYAPQLGRWITPDPLGFADGPNMYAYVHNSPLTKFDLYGLYGFGDDYDELDAMFLYGIAEVSAQSVVDFAACGGFILNGYSGYKEWSNAGHSVIDSCRQSVIEQMTRMPGNSATADELHRAADMGAFIRGVCDYSRLALNIVKMAARGANVLKMSKAEQGTAALDTVQKNADIGKNIVQNKSPKPDFIVGGNGTTIPTNKTVLERGFQKAEFPSCPTRSPGTEYTLPNGDLARIMEPSGPAGLRLSYTNSAQSPVSPFTKKPVHPPSDLSGISKKNYIRERTHVELTE